MLDHLANLIDQQVRSLGVLILPSCVEDKADPLEGFYLFLCFDCVAPEKGGGEGHLFEIFLEDVRLAVAINKEIDDLGPSLECFTAADKEIFLVKNLQNLAFYLLDEQLCPSFE